MLELSDATSQAQLEAVRGLMRGFIAWHRERHTQDQHLVDAYFDSAAFERELAALPGDYSPPAGRLLLATVDGESAGCVALHPLGQGYCEMKRMFVYPRYRGRGVGLALASRIIEEARGIGYRAMRLDTVPGHHDRAIALYRDFGFREIAPYCHNPVPGALFFECPL